MTTFQDHTYQTYKSPFGKLIIVSNGKAITNITLESKIAPECKKEADELTDKAAEQLSEYFAGKRREFDIPLDPCGSDFQCKVWKALKKIPYGQTRSYKQVAYMINNPNACRAVGLANNKNQIWIIIPCHRVIGSDGKLVGYGGGLAMKQKLLEIESNK